VSDQRGAKIPEVPFQQIELIIPLDDRKTCAMDFIENNLKRFLAEVAITPSAVRGEAKAGLREAVVDFLSDELRLSDFANPGQFSEALERETSTLKDSCGMSWGTARKCLNIFLRDATYNYYTRRRYGLEIIEPLLEVPLDNKVAQGIRRDMRRLKPPLPPLPRLSEFEKGGFSITELKHEQHESYQNAAGWIAREEYHTHRVHLDLLYFPRSPSMKSSRVSTHAVIAPAAE
jgi:hypothetical protein